MCRQNIVTYNLCSHHSVRPARFCGRLGGEGHDMEYRTRSIYKWCSTCKQRTSEGKDRLPAHGPFVVVEGGAIIECETHDIHM